MAWILYSCTSKDRDNDALLILKILNIGVAHALVKLFKESLAILSFRWVATPVLYSTDDFEMLRGGTLAIPPQPCHELTQL